MPTFGGEQHRLELQELWRERIKAMKERRVRVKIPQALHLMQRLPGMHYHFQPEVFFQIHGSVRFRFPAGEMILLPGDVGIIPTGLPHREKVIASDRPFRNMVVGFYSSSISMHFAVETESGKPDIETIGFYPTPELRHIVDLAELLVRFHHSTSRQRDVVCHAMMLTLLGLFADLADGATPDLEQKSQRVFEIKWIVRDQLHNPGLNVTFIAERLNLSPDYLSHLFHCETGEKLIHYIHRQRLIGAMESLANTNLSVSEIAWACGFLDAGYFTRVFHRHMGAGPLAYRRNTLKKVRELEARPKTIYYDHDEYSPGQPWTTVVKRDRRPTSR